MNDELIEDAIADDAATAEQPKRKGGPKPKPPEQIQSVEKRVYFTPDDWAQCQMLMRLHNYHKDREFSAFVNERIASMRGKKTVHQVMNDAMLAKIITLLNSIKSEHSSLGNSRNQIARHLNSDGDLYADLRDQLRQEEDDIKHGNELLQKIYNLLSK